MAKLHARDRTELLRMEKAKDVNDVENVISWQRLTITFMSDGTMLEKYDVRFLPSTFYPKGKLHSYGWKRKGKYTLTIDETRERYKNAGWKEVI